MNILLNNNIYLKVSKNLQFISKLISFKNVIYTFIIRTII